MCFSVASPSFFIPFYLLFCFFNLPPPPPPTYLCPPPASLSRTGVHEHVRIFLLHRPLEEARNCWQETGRRGGLQSTCRRRWCRPVMAVSMMARCRLLPPPPLHSMLSHVCLPGPRGAGGVYKELYSSTFAGPALIVISYFFDGGSTLSITSFYSMSHSDPWVLRCFPHLCVKRMVWVHLSHVQ